MEETTGHQIMTLLIQTTNLFIYENKTQQQ